MLTNATILRVTAPNAADAAGQITYSPAAGEIVPALRCSLTAPTRRQIYQLGSVIADATAMMRVRTGDLTSRGLGVIGEGWQVQVRIDRKTAVQVRIVMHVTDAVKLGMDNVTVFLRM